MTQRPLIPTLLLTAIAFAGGCVPHKSAVRDPWYGETDSLNKVVEDINTNNNRISTLFAYGYFEADIVEKQGEGKDPKKTFVNGDLKLLYRAPGELRVVGEKELGSVFDVGSNDTMYWLVAGKQTMWYGKYSELDRADPSIMPVRPDLLLEVLGVGRIESNFLQQPLPILRFNNDAHAYMIVWSVRLNDRWAARKEIWYDRETMLPTLVLLFDADGRILVRAYLTNHKAIGKDGGKIATSFKLFFPDSGSKLMMRLDDLALESDGDPSDASFKFPGTSAHVDQMIDIDQSSARPPQPSQQRVQKAPSSQPSNRQDGSAQ